ncbi:hypothetical protein BGZ47_007089 [Haplosporangium gracile]|nr:hypothetical protein BGZ47_007089 [Haplosporangium gracile]
MTLRGLQKRDRIYVEGVMKTPSDSYAEEDNDNYDQGRGSDKKALQNNRGSDEKEKGSKNNTNDDKDGGTFHEGEKSPTSTFSSARSCQAKASDDKAQTGNKRRRQHSRQLSSGSSHGSDSYDADDEAISNIYASRQHLLDPYRSKRARCLEIVDGSSHSEVIDLVRNRGGRESLGEDEGDNNEDEEGPEKSGELMKVHDGLPEQLHGSDEYQDAVGKKRGFGEEEVDGSNEEEVDESDEKEVGESDEEEADESNEDIEKDDDDEEPSNKGDGSEHEESADDDDDEEEKDSVSNNEEESGSRGGPRTKEDYVSTAASDEKSSSDSESDDLESKSEDAVFEDNDESGTFEYDSASDDDESRSSDSEPRPNGYPYGLISNDDNNLGYESKVDGSEEEEDQEWGVRWG